MEMEEVLTMVLDKVLLAILLAMIGLWINRKLSEYKSNLEHSLQSKMLLAESRLPSFTKLWQKTAPTSPTRDNKLDDNERKKLDSSLRDWYFENGNGLYLTTDLRDVYLNARESLKMISTDSKSEEEITKRFTKLRTDLKNEIGIYGYLEDKSV